MTQQRCTAQIRPDPGTRSVNVRSGPGVGFSLITRVPPGTAGLVVLEAQPDANGTISKEGRVFQWFRLRFESGGTGWVRDDLVDIQGNCGRFGYGFVGAPTRAGLISRTAPVPEPPDRFTQPAPPPAPVINEDERARNAAFNITAAFEGGGYSTYQNTDSGIVSYGRFQATLASGSLERLLTMYLQRAAGTAAERLRLEFMPRVRVKDQNLRNDAEFRSLLVVLAADPIMQETQNQFATDIYWTAALRSMMVPRGIVTPLGRAFIFDSAINHGGSGTEQSFLRAAEVEFRVPVRSKVGENGISEQQLITRAVQLRRDRLYAIAAARKLGGLRVRGDFWVNIVIAGDWNLQGDAQGEVLVKTGRKVQVRNP